MSSETRPGDLSRYRREEPVTLKHLLYVGGFALSLAGGGVLASYVQLQRTADSVDQIREAVRDMRAVQSSQQSQLTTIAQEQAVQTYRLNQLENRR